MIDYFFGKPRTGKTYRAVKLIYDDYIKDENSSPKFPYILTNIGGFKFKEINQIFRDRGSKSYAYKLVWKDFYEHLYVMYKMALDDKDDAELNRYAYSHKINDCLIVIDECSLYLKKYSDVISWFLAYHGHFKIRIVLIAQSPKQINAEYLVHAEIYYEAQPQSKQFTNNKLRYIHYSESFFSNDSKFGADIINSDPKIYDLYKSGEVDKPKKILYRYILYMFLAVLMIVFLFKFLMYRLTPPTVDKNVTTNQQQQQNYQVPESDSSFEHVNIVNNQDNIFLNVRCDDKACWNIDREYENTSIFLSYFKYILLNYKVAFLYEEVKTEIYALKPFKNSLSKKTYAKLVDYHYSIPKNLKDGELSVLFKPFKDEKQLQNNFKFNNGNLAADKSATSALARSD